MTDPRQHPADDRADPRLVEPAEERGDAAAAEQLPAGEPEDNPDDLTVQGSA